jgi:signal transduction histidine kinase
MNLLLIKKLLNRLLYIGLYVVFQFVLPQFSVAQVRPERTAQFPLDSVQNGKGIWAQYQELKSTKRSYDFYIKNKKYHGLIYRLPRGNVFKQDEVILSVPDYQINELSVYGYDSLTGISNLLIKYGDEIKAREYTSPSRAIQQAISMQKYSHLCVLYGRPGNIPQLPLLLWELDDYLQYWKRIELGYGILFGLLATYLLFIFLAFIQNKKSLYLLFFLWISVYGLYYFISSGFLKFYVFPEMEELFSTIRLILVVFGLYSMSEFALIHYGERKSMKFFVWFWYLIIAITVVLNSYNFYSSENIYKGYESQFVWLVRAFVIVFLVENIYLPIRHYRKTGKVSYLTYVLFFSSLHFFIYLYQTMFISDVNFDKYILGVSGLFVFEIISIAMGISVYTIWQKNKNIELIKLKGQIQRKMNLVGYKMRELERKKIASELHDDILNRLSMLLSLHRENLLTDVEITKNLDEVSMDIKEYAKGLFPVWVNQRPLNELINDYFVEYLRVNNVRLKLYIGDTVDSLQTIQKLQLFRLLQEFVKNAIVHGNPSEIEFSAVENQENQILATLKENGKGYQMESVKKGFGSLSVETRVNSLGGEIVVFSAEGQGVQWEVVFPRELITKSASLRTSEPAF